MTPPVPRALSATARELRLTFDATFALPPPPPAAPTVALLLVRAGGELLAVPRADLTGFVRGENLAPAPGRSPAFLGLAGVRGELFPVWSLAGLLGRAPASAPIAGWFLLTAAPGGAPCAFACEAFEKMFFAPAAALAAPVPRDASTVVPCDGALVSVVNLPALHAAIFDQLESTQSRRSPP